MTEAIGEMIKIVLSFGFPGVVILVLAYVVQFLYREISHHRTEHVELIKGNTSAMDANASAVRELMEEFRRRRI